MCLLNKVPDTWWTKAVDMYDESGPPLAAGTSINGTLRTGGHYRGNVTFVEVEFSAASTFGDNIPQRIVTVSLPIVPPQ